MTRLIFRLSPIFLFLVCLPAIGLAQCGGLCIYEVGAPDNGASAAGASARAEDATTAFWNPAGMTQLDRTELSSGIMIGYSDPKLDVNEEKSVGNPSGSVDGGDRWGGVFPLGGFTFAHHTTEDLRLGFSAGGTVGGSLDYGDDWIGRSYLTESDITVFTLFPSAAYQITEEVSIGIGVGVNYGLIDWDLRGGSEPNAPTVSLEDGDDWDVNGVVSFLIEPRDGTRIGIVYRSEVDMSLSGTVKNPSPREISFDATLVVPQGINVGLFQELDSETDLLFDAGWSDWSTFSDTAITVGPISGAIPRNFEDTWRVGAGLQHRPDGTPWTVRSGISYDSNPISSSERLPDTPISDAWRFSTGADYAIDEDWTIGMTYTLVYWPHIDYNEVSISQMSPVVIDGDTDDPYGHFFGFNVRTRFG